MLEVMENLKKGFMKRLITSLLWFAAVVFVFLQSVDFFCALEEKENHKGSTDFFRKLLITRPPI